MRKMKKKKVDECGNLLPTVYGVGINDYYGLVAGDNADPIVAGAYQAWNDMLKRCYSEKYLARKPTYIGCSVCPEWVYFTNFLDFYKKYYFAGAQLDKDIRFHGNKIYGPKYCQYVEQSVNSLFLDSAAARGEYLLGVDFHKATQKFRASINLGNGTEHLGYFDTELAAHLYYMETKLKHCFHIANNHPKGLPTLPAELKRKAMLLYGAWKRV